MFLFDLKSKSPREKKIINYIIVTKLLPILLLHMYSKAM